MPKTITETVEGEVLTMIEPYYVVTMKHMGVTHFLMNRAWTSFEELATEYPTVNAAAEAAKIVSEFYGGIHIVIEGRGNEMVYD
jgi:hypothetical protein